MPDDDIVRLEDLAEARAAVATEARKVVLVAAVSGPVAGIFMVGFVYFLYGGARLDMGYIVGVLFALMSVPLGIHWCRHYRSIKSQLDVVEVRLRNGERVRASEVKFHSYRT